MPHKLDFKIAHFSSEDRSMLARELLQQGPGIRGWASSRFSPFPQEVIFRLHEQCNLTKLQFLAHAHLIPEKIDIYIGDIRPGDNDSVFKAKFAQLGYVTLSDNEHSEFKARELKSVNVQCTGTFLKLVFHKNHLNKLNVYNQVALVALNIVGNEVEDNNNSVSPDGDGGTVPSKNAKGGDKTPLAEDLAFSMYVDTYAAETIKQMNERTIIATRDKRMEYAKKLKAAISHLKTAGYKLGKLEIEKRHAIDHELFDKAKLKKKQLEDYRAYVYQQLNINELLESKGKRIPRNDERFTSRDLGSPRGGTTSEDVTPSTSGDLPPVRKTITPPGKPPISPPSTRTPTPLKGPSLPLPGLGSSRRNLSPSSTPKPRTKRIFGPPVSAKPGSSNPPPATPTPTAAYTDYDERQLPALKQSKEKKKESSNKKIPADNRVKFKNRSVQESPEESSSSVASKRTSLTETEKKDADLPLQVFQSSLVEKFYSKNYSDKERGLHLLQEELEIYSYEATNIRPDRYTRAVVSLIRKALRDKVYSVAVLAAQTLSELTQKFFNQHRVPKKEIALTFEKLLPDLLAKTADNAQRNQNLAVAAISEMLEISLEKNIGVVGTELTKPLTHVVHPRSAINRANIVETQLSKLNASRLPKDRETGFTVKQLIEFGLSALQHQNCEVRKVGEKLLVTLYSHYPVAVRKALPLEDEPARRNVLFRNLFEQLEELDRKRQKQKSNASTPQFPSHHLQDYHQVVGYQGAQPAYMSTPGGSSTSSGFSTASSVGDRGQSNVPVISITPDEAEARGKTLSRLNSSQLDLREEEEDAMLSPGEVEDKTCIFCGVFDEAFSGTGMDLHYWKSCPLLTRCSFCKQVVEIASLSQHLLGECDAARDFRRCERCTEAIPKFEYQRHVLTAKCTIAKPLPMANHCPLCHDNIPPWDDGWRKHLMPSPTACLMNPRINPHGGRKNHKRGNGRTKTLGINRRQNENIPERPEDSRNRTCRLMRGALHPTESMTSSSSSRRSASHNRKR